MTIQHAARDAHHDLTWLIGALARALFDRAAKCADAMPALEKIAGCDFDAPLASVRPSLAHACRHLPQATIAALEVVEEVAMALAACLEHLPWREGTSDWAMAEVLGPDGPVRHDSSRLRLLVAGPGATTPLAEETLVFVLAGMADLRDPQGALRHVRAGMAHVAQDMVTNAQPDTPLLAAFFAR